MSQRTLESGSAIGHYLIDTVLGQGQSGVTYLAHHETTGAECVVKEFLPEAHARRGNDRSVVPLPECEHDLRLGVQRFLRDARSLIGISHPNIVPVLEAIEANGTAYMAMARVAGDRLSEALGRGYAPSPEVLLQVSLSLLDAVQTLHRGGLIHRDVKENNVQLCEDGTPILLDFGAARVGLLRRRLALGNAVRGDADYDDLDGNAGPWTDVHALGAMLFRVASALGKKGGRPCPPDIAAAIRFGIAAQQGNASALTGEWRVSLEELARQYGVQWPVPAAERSPVAANAGGDEALMTDAIGAEASESETDATTDAAAMGLPNRVRDDESDRSAALGEIAESEIAQSEIAQSEIAQSEIAQSEIAESEIAQSEIAQSEIAESEIAQSEIAQSEIAQSEIAQSEIAESEIAQSEIAQSEIAQSEIAESEVAESEVAESEVAESEVAESEVAESEVAESEVAESEVAESEVAESEVAESEVAESEVAESEVAESEVAESEVAESEVAESEVAESEVAESEVAESEVAESEVAESEVAESEVAESEVAESEVAESEVAESEVAETEVAETEVAETEVAETEVAETEVAESEVAQSEPASSEAAEGETRLGLSASTTSVERSDESQETSRFQGRASTRGATRKSRKHRKRERLREKAARSGMARMAQPEGTMPSGEVPVSPVVVPVDAGAAPLMEPAAQLTSDDGRAVMAAQAADWREPSGSGVVRGGSDAGAGHDLDRRAPDFIVDFDVAPTRAEGEPEPAPRKSGRFLAVASFVAVVGVLVGMAWLRHHEDHTTTNAGPPPAAQTPPAPPSPAPETVVAAPLEPMVGASPPTESAPSLAEAPIAPEVRTRISELLTRADAHVQALQLTTPAGDNAFEDFNEVLRLQPDNEDARRGIAAISARYVELADGAIVRGQYVAAGRYLELAQMVDPGNATAQARREELRKRRQSAGPQQGDEEAADVSVAEGRTSGEAGVVDRVRDFLTPAPGAATPPSRADEIRARLGGQ